MPSARFQPGETIRVRRDAPSEYRPNELASVCGVRPVDAAGSEEPTFLITIEYGNGDSIEVSEKWIERADDPNKSPAHFELARGDVRLWIPADGHSLHIKCITKHGDPVELIDEEVIELIAALKQLIGKIS